mmetsp:Transcript_5307/g.7673  ORF Transcript_5307/g.7673 Transcript_5307/m.7673 type:complete len:88 (-) Transcript_5307:406-669(-)
MGAHVSKTKRWAWNKSSEVSSSPSSSFTGALTSKQTSEEASSKKMLFIKEEKGFGGTNAFFGFLLHLNRDFQRAIVIKDSFRWIEDV